MAEMRNRLRPTDEGGVTSRKNPSKVVSGRGHSKLGQRLFPGFLHVHEFDKWAVGSWLSAIQTSAFARGISVRSWRREDCGRGSYG